MDPLSSEIHPVASGYRPTAALSRLLLLHAVVTFAAGVVLVVAPGLVPGTVGIALDPRAYLVSYLLAAAELGFAVLSYQARRLTDADAIRAVVAACVTLHAASALLEVYAFARGVSAAIWINVVARALIIGLFLRLRPSASAREHAERARRPLREER